MEKSILALSRPRYPISFLNDGEAINSLSAETKLGIEKSVTYPLTASRTTSIAEPAGVVTVGIPVNCASISEIGRASLSEVRRAISQALQNFVESIQPKKMQFDGAF